MNRTSPLNELINQSMDELEAKTQAQIVWGFGTFDRFELDQDVGHLTFINEGEDASRVAAPAQIIGTWDSVTGSWMWAWSNPSIVDVLRQDAEKVRDFGEKNEFAQLTLPSFGASEDDAWEMTAIAVKVCERQAAYRCPAGTTFVFVSLGDFVFA